MSARFAASLPSIFIGFIAVGAGVILTFSWAYRGRPGAAGTGHDCAVWD